MQDMRERNGHHEYAVAGAVIDLNNKVQDDLLGEVEVDDCVIPGPAASGCSQIYMNVAPDTQPSSLEHGAPVAGVSSNRVREKDPDDNIYQNCIHNFDGDGSRHDMYGPDGSISQFFAIHTPSQIPPLCF